MQITVGNLSVSQSFPIEAVINGFVPAKITGEILTGDMHDMNTFDVPDAVGTKPFKAELSDGGLKFVIPPCSVVHLTAQARD